MLAPVWIAGLWALLHRPRLRALRFLAVAWFVLVLVFTVTGGKPYYLAGLFPVLLAAGAIETDAWLGRGRRAARRGLLAFALLSSALVSSVIALPILPAPDAGPVIAVNPDAGETIGWPELTRTVAHVYRQAHAPAVILTENYGEAGAIDRYEPGLGLPPAYSGHNAFWEWGPPPDHPGPVVAIGLDRHELHTRLAGCRTAARIHNNAHVDNDEHGTRIELCTGTRAPWSRTWPNLKRLG